VEEDLHYDQVLGEYYGDEQITALIHLKVDSSDLDEIVSHLCAMKEVMDVFLVTGEVDLVVKVKLNNYAELKRFLVNRVSCIEGVKETRTNMVVTAFKEHGATKID